MLGAIIHGRGGLKLVGAWHGAQTSNRRSGFGRCAISESLESGVTTGVVVKELMALARRGLARCGRRHSLLRGHIVQAVAHVPGERVQVVPLTEPPRGHEYDIVADWLIVQVVPLRLPPEGQV